MRARRRPRTRPYFRCGLSFAPAHARYVASHRQWLHRRRPRRQRSFQPCRQCAPSGRCAHRARARRGSSAVASHAHCRAARCRSARGDSSRGPWLPARLCTAINVRRCRSVRDVSVAAGGSCAGACQHGRSGGSRLWCQRHPEWCEGARHDRDSECSNCRHARFFSVHRSHCCNCRCRRRGRRRRFSIDCFGPAPRVCTDRAPAARVPGAVYHRHAASDRETDSFSAAAAAGGIHVWCCWVYICVFGNSADRACSLAAATAA
jgi:hypothetical protein